MSERRHTRPRANSRHEHLSHARGGVDSETLPSVIDGKSAWHAIAVAVTGCRTCERHRTPGISEPAEAVRRWRSPRDADERPEATYETDAGTQSTTLEPGTVAAVYAGIDRDTDRLSAHAHFGSDHSVRLLGPDHDVYRTAEPDEGAIGVRTWTVTDPDPGQWTVEIRSPERAEPRDVSVTLGTLSER